MEKEMQTFTFMVNGFQVEAQYPVSFIEDEVKPLLRKWSEQYRTTNKRVVVFLAAPPATGKSTLAQVFAKLSCELEDVERVQDLGMDGFHHYQRYIETHEVEVDGKSVPMKSVKGCPESFDFERLQQLLLEIKQKDCKWPYYNRKLHDVEDDVIEVQAPIVVVEGNYLLLDEAPWNQLQSICDDSIFISADQALLRKRLIQRKMMGGMLPHEAIAFCEQSDLRNVKRILAHQQKSHHTYEYNGTTYQKR